tara:strand:- start:579 stop:926 length:348 start_codon:yes stop_codon:yes gene_type:complete
MKKTRVAHHKTGESIFLKALNYDDCMKLMNKYSTAAGTTQTEAESKAFNMQLVRMSACDSLGEVLFKPQQIGQIEKFYSGMQIMHLMTEAMTLNDFDLMKDVAGETIKNSEALNG